MSTFVRIKKHIPMIKFPNRRGGTSKGSDIGTVTTQKVGGINTKVIQINSYDQLPPQFHRKGISQVEMDAINSGGASLF